MIGLRQMKISDYDAVISLWSQTENLSLKDADSPSGIERYLSHNSGLSFVALDDERIIGAVLAGTDGRRGYLQHLSVIPAFRQQGIGRMLVNHATRALAAKGIAKTHLFVLCGNSQAQQFYEKMGWVLRDEVKMYSYNSSKNPNV